MKIEKIYVASNGDVILEYDHKLVMHEIDPAEYALMIAKAANMMLEGETEFATIKNNIVNGTAHTEYYDFSDNLIGISEVTIPYEYEEKHDMFFIRHVLTNPLYK